MLFCFGFFLSCWNSRIINPAMGLINMFSSCERTGLGFSRCTCLLPFQNRCLLGLHWRCTGAMSQRMQDREGITNTRAGMGSAPNPTVTWSLKDDANYNTLDPTM